MTVRTWFGVLSPVPSMWTSRVLASPGFRDNRRSSLIWPAVWLIRTICECFFPATSVQLTTASVRR